MRIPIALVTLAIATSPSLPAQGGARATGRPRPAATAPAAPARAVTAEPVGSTTFAGLGRQSGDFGVAEEVPGGGVRFAVTPGITDTVWLRALQPVPVTARVTAEMSVTRVGPGGAGFAVGSDAESGVVPLVVTVLPGGRLAVRDRSGASVIAPTPIPGFVASSPLTIVLEARGSAVAVSVNGRAVATGVAGAMVSGSPSAFATAGADVTLRSLRVERLVGVPAAEAPLRTSERVPLPATRPARFFDSEVRGGGSTVVDTTRNTVTLTGPPDTDRASFALRLGYLPAAVRIEADISMPASCRARYAGFMVGRHGDRDSWYGVLTLPDEGTGSHVLRAYRIGDGVQGLGGASVLFGPFATPTSRLHLAVELRGRTLTWIHGDRTEPVEVDADLTGQFGLIAGPGCAVTYENLSITPAS